MIPADDANLLIGSGILLAALVAWRIYLRWNPLKPILGWPKKYELVQVGLFTRKWVRVE